MVKIIGVDFSGDKRDTNTWITEGQLQGAELTISDCRSIKRADLIGKLTVESYAVAAMDFPFSVPIAFARYWQPDSGEMPDLWSTATNMKLCDFNAKCEGYAAQMEKGKKHPLRIGDLYSIRPLSCLNTRIRPMTFYGMQMLHGLWESASGFRVPPLDDSGRNGPALLEVMPGAAMESFGLLYGQYKDNGDANEIKENRKAILRELASRSNVGIANLDAFRGIYLTSHDGLDSLVAAVVAARWELAKSKFHHPTDTRKDCSKLPDPNRCNRASEEALTMTEEEAAKREGWIYMPL